MRIGGENVVRAVPASEGAHGTKHERREEVQPAKAEGDLSSPFARILRGLGQEVDHGEKIVRRAVDGGGKDLGPAELLALQAGVYRYSEAVDLSAKLVDRATSGVKTVLQGQ